MSLIITSSNKAGETNQNQIDAPYQYRNDFRSGMKIPANSEIAVESVKINRNPTLDYEDSQVTLFWFGERLEVSGSLENSMSWVIPSINRIARNLAPEDFKENFEPIIKRALSVHPEIDTVNGITMTPIHTTTSVVHPFQGFRYNINQIGASATSLIPPSGYEKLIFGDIDDYDAGTLTAGSDDTYVQLQPVDDVGGPISLFDGEVTFDSMTGNNWTVGLARPIYNEDSGAGDYIDRNPTLEYTALGNGDGLGPDEDQLYDYAAQIGTDDFLRLYHLVPITGGGPQGAMEMREINYYENTDSATSASNSANSSFATGTPIASASITDITFKVENEIVEISASGNVIVRCNTITSASFKDQVPKPVNQNCWKMYPTMGLWEDQDEVEITSYRCRTSSTIDENILPNNWTFKTKIHADMERVFQDAVDSSTGLYEINNPWNNAWTWAEDLDSRPLMRRFLDLDGAAGDPRSSDYVRPYKGLNASIMEDYEPLFVVGKSERYTDNNIQEWQPNSKNVLGFSPFSVVPLEESIDESSGQASFTSTTRPNMSSEHSTFIRVPTLNHKTFNFGTGNPSKILFQVPRFDNSGAETGALFFQNQDKSFIDLNNPTDITVTDLDVQFVRKDEKFAKDLTGSSEVVFVVRKKAKM
tara:strand:- start:42 stop:1976 length:1935 start_codon:yes stop_codon:yes gene_type:complete